MAGSMKWIMRLDGTNLPGKSLIGGKAHSIARLMALGLRVPPAFVVTTEAHAAFLETGEFPDGLVEELERAIAWLEESTGRDFGGASAPLLVSVRSGAAISMPGMMDTILNVGMNDQTQTALAAESGDATFAQDTHRRFAQLYGNVVLKADAKGFDSASDPQVWREMIHSATGKTLPDDPREQLLGAVTAVFESWNARRARRYREHQKIPHDLGTAVTVQAMVFGNLDERSGTGVLFSRNPSTGEDKPFGEYLGQAQGEDVVSGEFTPKPLATMAEIVPEAFNDLMSASKTLERAERDVQDIEFTVERGTLYLLQARSAKLAPQAAVRTAVEMANEGLIDRRTAICRIPSERIRILMSPVIPEAARVAAAQLAKGEGACPGVGIGMVVSDSDEAERLGKEGIAVVLARPTTSPHDVHGMIAATAVITEEGGSTSHAAVVSRALGTPCVVGCGQGRLSALNGQTVTVDGQTGQIWAGALEVVVPDEVSDGMLAQLTEWAEQLAPIRIISADGAKGLDALDLAAIEGAEESENLPQILAGNQTAKGAAGGAIATDEGVRAAIDAGLEFIVADPRLPSLLAAVQANVEPVP